MNSTCTFRRFDGAYITIPFDLSMKDRFERKYGEGAFGQLLSRLSQEHVSFDRISDDFDITGERIGQLYRKLVQPHTKVDGNKRLAHARQYRLFCYEYTVEIALFLTEAISQGVSFEPIPAEQHGHAVKRKSVVLGRKPCALHICGVMKQNEYYARGVISKSSLKKHTFQACIVTRGDDTPFYFIIPSPTILDGPHTLTPENAYNIYLPVSPSAGNLARIDWSIYEGAWHLLINQQS